MSAIIKESQLLELDTSYIPENQLLERDDEHDDDIPESQLLERDPEGDLIDRKKELLNQIKRLKFLMLNTGNSRMRRQYGDEICKLRKLRKSL